MSGNAPAVGQSTAPQDSFQLDHTINKQGKLTTLVWPIGRTMAELFDKLGWLNRVLELVAIP